MATSQALSVQKALDFTRDNEREADRTGFQTLTKAGFDPRAMPQFFERLLKNSRIYDSSAPEYLRTHPLDTARIADMENRAEPLPYRQVPDSLDFQLMRARLKALLHNPSDAVNDFDGSLKEKRYSSEIAQRYGLTLALMRAKNLSRAETEFATLRRIAPPNAFIENLGASLKMAEGKTDAAIAAYRAGLRLFPRHRALVYGLADAEIQTGRPAEAEKYLLARKLEMPDDAHLYELLAKAQAAQGKQMLSHRSLAEAYVLEDNPTAAIEQLQIALRNGNGNFYDQSEVEARLKELRAENDRGPDGKKAPAKP
jgi:predicted Zn-dependent protease